MTFKSQISKVTTYRTTYILGCHKIDFKQFNIICLGGKCFARYLNQHGCGSTINQEALKQSVIVDNLIKHVKLICCAKEDRSWKYILFLT